MSADEGGIKGDQDRGDGEDSERVREKEKDGDMTDGPSTAEVMHQLVYDGGDGVRVVETQVSMQSQESYELVPEWPEGQPVPHYPTPPHQGAIQWLVDQVRLKLGNDKELSSSSSPNPEIDNIANLARRKVETHYKVRFSTYSVQTSSVKEVGPEDTYGAGTLFTILLDIAPSVQGHHLLQLLVLQDENGGRSLVNFGVK